ncbi:MAG TPA: phosphatidate cytidylyltransferase [Candidatus Methylomirabilis sp.]|nr:phosphatidate cytidylyltransferase [Candidatus Methylomirabilis sp.]
MTWKRVATAVVLIPLVVFLVLWGSTAMVSVGIGLVILLALFEFFALGDAIGHRAYRFWTATCALGLVYVQWLAAIAPSYELAGGLALHREIGKILGVLPTIADVFFIFLLGVAALTLWTSRPLVEGLPAAGISSSALILVALPLTYAIRLHGQERNGPQLLLFALVITWVGDTAAYFAGRGIGKHKLAPHLSPNKTWEGTVASILGALLVGLVFSRWMLVPLPHLLAMAAIGNIGGQAGDLLESAYKRSAGVKDSGSLLPGHGGVLDRVDALILTFPVVWYYWIWIYLPNK